MNVKPLAQKSLRVALALSLALASGSAAALGLGQIELKSRLGQPLVAEIPIISTDPAELEQLRAGLPSPETFARIGLQLPDEFVSTLQFTPGVDAAGRPVIRVTSQAPVTDPLLTFLVEVDWGQGRLVREYSALVDAPRTVSAPVQPTIEEVTVGPANTIEREPVVAPADVGDSAAAASATSAPVQPGSARAPAQVAPTQATRPAPAAPQETTPRAAAVARVATPAAPSGSVRKGAEYGPVKAGDSLSQIAGELAGPSVEQTMIALLRANPGAFIDGNINRLKRGAVLTLPADAAAQIDATSAAALVRAQTQAWRADTRRPVQQPQARAGSDGVDTTQMAQVAVPAGRRTADARLEIVPPGASNAKRAGTQSGIQAGGEGEMLRQELQQTKETLAARDAEVAEMKARIDELEKLQTQQQQLITMKDSELASAQQRLAGANQAKPATAEAKQQAAEAGSAGLAPWMLGGAGLLIAALAGWWFSRRRRSSTASSFREAVSKRKPPSLADAFAPSATLPRESVVEPVTATPAVRGEPAWHARAPVDAGAAPSAAPPSGEGAERLELARAFIDLGDQESARNLLAEVLADSDASVRESAERMLRELD